MQDLSGLGGCIGLPTWDLSGCPKLACLSVLAMCTRLQTLYLSVSWECGGDPSDFLHAGVKILR